MKFIKYLFLGIILSSCAIEQDYFFEKKGEVKMNIAIDMGSLFKNLPSDGGNNGLGNIEDSIEANTDIRDSMSEFGITDFEVEFDTATHKLFTNMTFKNMKYFKRFMNKDRDEKLKPIEIDFSSSKFSVKNCAALISDEMLKGLGDSQKGKEGIGDMEMSSFFTFKTTYHFPYQVKEFKSASGKGFISEDKKSIFFNNTLDEFSDEKFNGDLEVFFK